MQQEREDFLLGLESCEAQEHLIGNLWMYEEYSKKTISKTIRERRDKFANANLETRKELEEQVKHEINEFRTWLEETKNFEPNTAHYCATSLKSMLLGLPVGEQIARLFDAILNKNIRE
jgi:hypothetical protein